MSRIERLYAYQDGDYVFVRMSVAQNVDTLFKHALDFYNRDRDEVKVFNFAHNRAILDRLKEWATKYDDKPQVIGRTHEYCKIHSTLDIVCDELRRYKDLETRKREREPEPEPEPKRRHRPNNVREDDIVSPVQARTLKNGRWRVLVSGCTDHGVTREYIEGYITHGYDIIWKRQMGTRWEVEWADSWIDYENLMLGEDEFWDLPIV